MSNPANTLRIASPCPMSWDAMTGDAKVRYCGKCRKNVYNLVGMTKLEVRTFLREREGSPCIRMFERSDGTLLRGDCPVGKRRWWRRTVSLCAAAAAMLLMSVGLAAGRRSGEKLDWAFDPVGWLNALAQTEMPVPGRVTMGAPMMPADWQPEPELPPLLEEVDISLDE